MLFLVRKGKETMSEIMIIGAGISGCFIAHHLSKYQCHVTLIDKENDIANESTMANSAIIHAGEDPADGTLKAKLNVLGNRQYQKICEELGVEFKQTSAFVAATNKEEEESIENLAKRAAGRGIPVEMLDREEALRREPNLSGQVTKVIELPTTGIVYPWEVAQALAEECAINGVSIKLSEKVIDVKKTEEGFLVTTDKGAYRADYVINAAGVFADQISKMVLGETPYTITARKGEYYVTDRLTKPVVSRVIYPAPSVVGKGILATPTVHGNLLVGPNANAVEDKDDISVTKQALDMIRKMISKTVENIPYDKVIRNFAGLRASGNNGDFYIKEEENAKGFIQVACIDSPGLSSAPAIADMVVNEIMNADEIFEKKTDWKRRKKPVRLKHMTEEEKNELVKKDPRFGRIICRCETVTEGEIIDIIKRPMGATTVKGVKKRIRPGMGRCQGGFCEPLVVEILARELGVSKMDILYDGEGSNLFVDEL